MAIVIGSDDIYGVSNQNILSNNRIDGVSYQNKEVSITESVDETLVCEDITQTDEGIAFSDNNSTVSTSTDTVYASYSSKGHCFFVRVEAYYSTFTFPVSRSFDVKQNNFTFKSAVEYADNGDDVKIDLDSVSSTDTSSLQYLLYYNKADSVGLFYDSTDFGTLSTATQEGLLGDGTPYIEKTYNYTDLKAQVSLQTIISINGYSSEEIEEDSSLKNYYKVTVTYPTKISGIHGCIERGLTGSLFYDSYYYPSVFAQITSIDVYLQYSDISVSNSGSLLKVGTFDSTSNTFSLETNSLIQSTTSYNKQPIATYNANQIFEDWKNGRESVDIDVMIGEFYDENGNLVISTQDESLPMTFNIGDIVVPLTIDESGNETGLSNVSASYYSPVAYKVYGIQTYYDGACWQKLNLISAVQAEVCYILLDIEDGVDVTITRVSAASETDSTGVLKVPIAKAGDVVTIEFSYSGDKKYSNIQCTVNDSEYTSGDEYTISGTTEVYIRATTFEVLTWEQIDSICSDGLEEEYFSVGDSKNIFINEGFGTSSLFDQYHDVVILGINHDSLADGRTASLTIGMTDCLTAYRSYSWAEETGVSWENSLLRNDYIPNTILPMFPEDLQAVIKTVVKGSFGSYLNETLFPLAVTEVMGQNEQTYNEVYASFGSGAYGDLMDDGDIYEYWESVKDGTVANNRKKLRQYTSINDGTFSKTYSPYFTRSYVETRTSKFFVYFSRSGEIEGNPTTYTSGVSLAFCVGSKPYTKTLEDASWEEISSISETGNASEYFSIGDTKTIELTDGQTIQVRIIGFNQDTLSDGTSLAGITFESVNVLNSEYAYNSSKNYDIPLLSNDLYTTTLVSIFNNLIPSDLYSVIKTIQKISSAENDETLSYTTVNLFLPYLMNIGLSEYSSGYEIFSGEFIYTYYQDTAHITSNSLKKTVYGEETACSYWTSSFNEGYSSSGYSVMPVAINEDGEAEQKSLTDTAHMAFCFCV